MLFIYIFAFILAFAFLCYVVSLIIGAERFLGGCVLIGLIIFLMNACS